VTLIDVRVLGENGSTVDVVLAGINWAVDNGAARNRPFVVNLSLGGDKSYFLDEIVRFLFDASDDTLTAQNHHWRRRACGRRRR
jgi:hypothetical protein